jgi:hypothetical protein
MRYRLLRSLSVSAPRMTVRSHVPLRIKVIAGLVGFAAAVAIGVTLGRIGASPGRAATDTTIGRLLQENQALRDARGRPGGTEAVPDARRVMDDATIRELGEQVTRLAADNAKLREDVAFYEAATADRMPAGAADAGIALRRFQVTTDAEAHRARYRILMTQDVRAGRDFVGSLQLVATLRRGTAVERRTFPDPAAAPADDTDAQRFAIAFRSFKRIDGALELPADATLVSLEADVLERGRVRVRQVVTPEGSGSEGS